MSLLHSSYVICTLIGLGVLLIFLVWSFVLGRFLSKLSGVATDVDGYECLLFGVVIQVLTVLVGFVVGAVSYTIGCWVRGLL